MSRLLALLAVGAALLGVMLLWPREPSPAEAYLAFQRAEIQAVADRQAADDWATFRAWFLPAVGVLGLLAAATVLTAGAWALWARRRPLVTLEALQLPVDRAALHRGAYVQLPYALLEHRTQAAIAAGPGVPHTYSPHITVQNRQEGQGAPPAQLAPPVAVPSFSALLQQGAIGPGQPLLLGYTAEGPLTGALKDWRSGAVAGLPGAGKTTTQRFIAAQAAMQGARLVVLDPHGGAGNAEETLSSTLSPLAPAFLCAPASDPAAMLQALRLVHDIMDRRLHGEAADAPIFAFIDEGTALLGHATIGPELARLLESITLQGRKTLIQCVIGGQGFNADRVPTTLRDNLASTYVHRMRRNQARALLPTEEARKVETLPTGAAVLWRADGTLADVVIPLTTAADMQAVGRLLTQDAVPRAGGVLIDGAPWWEKAAAGSAGDQHGISTSTPAISTAADPYVTRVIACFLSGLDLKETVEALHPEIDTKSSGMIYRRKKAELEDIIRAELRRRSEHKGEAI